MADWRKSKKLDYSHDKKDGDEQKIVVSNLPWKTDEALLRETFIKCGKIIDIEIAHDKVDDKPKGYAFIVFEHEASKTRALAKEFVIEERTLILRECMGRNEYLRSRGLPEEKKSRKPAAADKSEAGQDAAPVSWPSAPAGDAASGEKAHLPAVLKRMEEKKRKQEAAAAAAPPAKKQREREKDLSQVCRAFQQGKCSRGQNCKFAHTDKVQGGNGGDKKPKNEEGKDMKKKRNNMSQKKRKQMYLERTGQLESQ